jgi:hypothetical protein
MLTTDLEIALHRAELKDYKESPLHTVELRFRDPRDEGLSAPVRGTARFDFVKLKSLETDEAEYGRELTQSLFAGGELGAGFRQFRTVAFSSEQDATLRLRLSVGPSAPELESLRWETLRDPDDVARRLLTSQNIFFSRFMSGSDWRPIQLRPKSDLRALVVISSPKDLGPQPGGEGGWAELAPLDVAAERSFAETSLKEFNTTILATGEATVANIFDRLREEHDILYLICHGALSENGDPWLILEDEAGNARPVAGQDFAARIGELTNRPRLVVLASCQSAGTGHVGAVSSSAADAGEPATQDDGGALPALGPRLMRAGIPAVLAMQGRVLMKTVAKFMPVFFEELRREGQIDRAMTVARGAVRDEADGWSPLLYMRLLSGRIWYVPGFSSADENDECWPALLTRIKRESCTPIVGSGLLEPLIGPTREIARRWAEKHRFPMFPADQEDLPQVAQYLSVVQEDYYLRDAFVTELLAQLGHRDEPGAKKKAKPERRLLDAISAAGAKQRAANPSEPHRVLASLGCPLYVTTNPDDLLADALREAQAEPGGPAKRAPQVELCRWREDIEWPPSVFDGANESSASEGEDDGYTPSAERPLVYHLFGHLSVLDSLVLTEDNYFDYLIGVSRRGKENPIPSYVGAALASTALLFVGFKIDDWDFRVFFRSLRSQPGSFLRQKIKHVAVQIDPEADRFLDPERARRYLQKYFVGAYIYVYWGSTEDFLGELRTRWEAFLQGEQP